LLGREGKGRERKGREGKGREGKGREGKGREGRDGEWNTELFYVLLWWLQSIMHLSKPTDCTTAQRELL
jgi:hypothetical protein